MLRTSALWLPSLWSLLVDIPCFCLACGMCPTSSSRESLSSIINQVDTTQLTFLDTLLSAYSLFFISDGRLCTRQRFTSQLRLISNMHWPLLSHMRRITYLNH